MNTSLVNTMEGFFWLLVVLVGMTQAPPPPPSARPETPCKLEIGVIDSVHPCMPCESDRWQCNNNFFMIDNKSDRTDGGCRIRHFTFYHLLAFLFIYLDLVSADCDEKEAFKLGDTCAGEKVVDAGEKSKNFKGCFNNDPLFIKYELTTSGEEVEVAKGKIKLNLDVGKFWSEG
jgi:hypothetical protein